MTQGARVVPCSIKADLGPNWEKEARLRSHLERRIMSCEHLLARAHGQASAFFVNPDRFTMAAESRAAIEEVNELSISLLKLRIRTLNSWLGVFKLDGGVEAVVGFITADFKLHQGACGPVSATTIHHEANLALGAWDGPEEIFKLMEGDRNVAK
jgi:hypothetical protein